MKIFTNFYYLPSPNLINIYNKTKSNGETRKKIPSSPYRARKINRVFNRNIEHHANLLLPLYFTGIVYL